MGKRDITPSMAEGESESGARGQGRPPWSWYGPEAERCTDMLALAMDGRVLTGVPE